MSGARFPSKPDTCIGCPLYADGEGFAWGEGPTDAKIMAIGEALGEDEAFAGRPFIGGSGRILNRQLRLAGLDRDGIYVTNVCKCRPPNNRAPTAEEIRHCSQYLKQELKVVSEANVIVCCGDTALSALTSHDSIAYWRGSVLEAGGRKVIGTFHPAHIMRQQHLWPVGIFDWRKAKYESQSPEIHQIEVRYNLRGNPRTDGLRTLEDARRLGFVGLDIETHGVDRNTLDEALDPARSTIICCGAGSVEGHATCYFWDPAAADLIRQLAEDPSIEKVGQNSESFDWPYINRQQGIEFKGKTFDTMLAFHLLNSSLPKDLGFIGSFYVDFANWKREKGDLALYNCKDVDATVRSYVAMQRELKTLGMHDLYYGSVMPVQPVLRSMNKLGLKKDVNKAMLWSVAIRNKIAEREKQLSEGLGYYFNVRSPKQLMKLLYEDLALPVQYTRDPKTKKNRPTANAAAIERLVEISDNPILHAINEIRSANTQCSTFVEVETDEHDFVHPTVGCSKAATGRFNSENPNGQNIPVSLREIYVPDDPDYVLMESDWSQVEWRLQILGSGDPVGLELLARGVDNHKAVAAEAYGLRYDDVTDAQRHLAKFIVYGLGYGRSEKSIADKHKIPLSHVMDFVGNFQRKFHVFWNWRNDLPKRVEQDACLINPFGRRRWWYTRQVTEIYNFLPQSTGADMMYKALILLHQQLPKGASVRMTVHDSVLTCAHRDVAKQAAECLKDIMHMKWPLLVERSARPENVKKFYPNGWFCPSDTTLGRNWAECKNKKVQAELRKLWLEAA